VLIYSTLIADFSDRMSDAVKLATLNTVMVLAEIVKSMEEGVEFVVTKTTFIDERTKVIESKVDIVIGQGQVMDSKQDAMLQQQKEMTSLMKKIYDREHTKAGHEKTQDAKSRPGQLKTKTDPGENKRVALTQVATHFSDFSPKWNIISKETKAQRKEIRTDSVPGTGKWLLNEEVYKAWADQEKPVLWIRGNAGIGKSFLAEAIITSFETSSNDRRSFAYFFFREEEDNLRSFTEARKYRLSFTHMLPSSAIIDMQDLFFKVKLNRSNGLND
jgi:transcriptional regulator with PAS, ATPase and Fis domain